MLYRAYTPADRDACLAVFDGNADRYFAPAERAFLEQFLDRPQGYFGVLCDDAGRVVGCGGYAERDGANFATLTWGMVARELHGRGLGKRLTLERLRLLAATAVRRVLMHTSQETVGFYKKLGFTVTRHVPDGYRQGLDRIDLELIFDDTTRRRLLESSEPEA
jgi:ribosomal protein S18 acetylase RimI-like enzyme